MKSNKFTKLKGKKDNSSNNEKTNEIEKFWLISIPLLCVVLLFLLALLLFFPSINLKGKKEIILDIGSKYTEEGYEANYFGKNLTKEVKVENNINYKKLGKYKITYQVGTGFFKTYKTRTIIISDNIKPKIDLFGSKNTYVCPKKDYVEPGFKASDNYDGNITKDVKVKKYLNKIVYTVRDKSHNARKITRNIIYKDNKKPEIILTGGDIVYAFVGEEFTDPGYKVIDNCDNDITDKIKIEGKVDTNTPGTYEITYKVTDKALNTTVKKRTVIVARRGQNGTVYLTFDDGPRDGTTNVILDILKNNGVKATFFVTSNGPDELIKREYDEGHTVGLHTSTHDYSYLYSSFEAYFEDLEQVKSRVDNITKTDAKIIRFPGGSSNTISRKYQQGLMSTLTEEVLKRGYHYFDWNLNSGDAGIYNDPDAISNNVINHLSKDRVNIILMHDIKSYTRDALEKIIKYGKENGFIFDKITMDTEMLHQKINN